ncbi:hypothetical protein M0802_002786 [Mischocyttarus mexicanus]|nr:hypothetical protein M0802_002786 [Mischocyttarus mexicanus]
MWNLSKSFILVAFIGTVIVNFAKPVLTSNNLKNLQENLSFHFEQPMDKCEKEKYEFLKLENVGLTKVKRNFVVSRHMESINLENNKISEISPEAFDGVPFLSCLSIRDNNIPYVFERFLASFIHLSLNKLNLAHTAFNRFFQSNRDSVFSKISNREHSKTFLPNLTHLDISGNKLKELPIYLNFSFPFLTHLYLSDNELNSDTFDRIPATTQYLYLERNSEIVNISNFPKHIHGLYLNENNIKWNENHFEEYPNLKILSLRKCYDILSYFNHLELTKLVDLDISSNDIDYIDPQLFDYAESLKRLSLDKNNLYLLSFLESLKSLTHLSIAYNKLSYITNDSLANLKNLRSLNLRGNIISVVQNNAFSNLSMLEKLDLSENQLSILPSLWMEPLENLEYVNLNMNLFPDLKSMNILSDTESGNVFIGNKSYANIAKPTIRLTSLSVIVRAG